MALSLKKIKEECLDFLRFVSQDIWRVNDHEERGIRYRINNVIRTIILASRGFSSNNLIIIASALTYFTLLAIVPLLSLILGIAKGFNVQEVLQEELMRQLPAHNEILSFAFRLVDSVLEASTKGVIMGVGIIFIIWSLWAIMNHIERAFNIIWDIPKGRKIYRKITDLFASIIVLPLMLILSSGVSIYFRTVVRSSELFIALDPILSFLLKLIPYFLACLLFTLIYIIIPNTKVKFKNALIAGLIAGVAFQAFQYLYINGQLWVNRYNAIYGSFAAIPLLLLWIQLTWIIVLFGAEIAFSSQNIRNFYFEKETKSCSLRYRYFFSILIMNIICKRFENGETPLSTNEISSMYHIPIRLTIRTVNNLYNVHLLNETYSPQDDGVVLYQPGMDINKITIGKMAELLFDNGTENFLIDTEVTYQRHWSALINMEKSIKKQGDTLLVKDL